MRWIQLTLGALGVAIGWYGALLLLDLGGENLRAAGAWLIGGVVLHDAVLAPATIVLAHVATRVLGRRLPVPVIVGSIVLASATLIAIPVLGREHARPDNATLLDRDYVLGWFVLAGLTLLVVSATLVRNRMIRRGGGRGTGLGG